MANQAQFDHAADGKPPTVLDHYFEVSLLLMLATSFAALALTGKLDLPSTLAFSAALASKLWGRVHGGHYNLQPSTATRLGVLYLFFYAFDLLILSSGPSPIDRTLTATVHLVVFTTIVKIFSLRTPRDYGYIAALSFLMMLAGAVLTVSTVYLVGFSFYILASISTFASYEIKRSADAVCHGRQGQPSTAGSRGPSITNRGTLEKALVATSGALALGIVSLASLLFFVVPRYRTGYLSALAVQPERITGFSETVSLGDIGKIKRSNVVVMRVKVEGDPRQVQGVQWRGIGLTSFDGKRWYNDNSEQTPVLPSTPGRFTLPLPEGLPSRPHSLLRYRVLLSAVSTDVLFVAATPLQLKASLRLLTLDQTHSLHNPRHDTSAFGYDVVTQSGLPAPQELRRAPTDYPPDVRLLYLRLPALDPAVTTLARAVTASNTNNYDRALSLQNYLRQHFGYTLDPVGIEPQDPVGSFLLRSKQGYCEYFAAAMALMLRTVDVPSRVVNGFQTGSYNRVGKDFVVRARDAHTWVEVYFPGHGWIPFDPTPADPNQVAETWSALDDYLDALNVFWSEWVINYDFGHQVRLARVIDQESAQIQWSFRNLLNGLERRGVRLAGIMEGWLARHPLFVPGVALVLLITLALSLTETSVAELRLLWRWRLRRHHAPMNTREATLVYRRLLKILRRKGLGRTPSQTPREFALRFAGTQLANNVWEFTEIYNALRFGGGPASSARLLELLEEIRRGAVNP